MDTFGEVDLEDLHDEYREALEELIAARAAGEAPPESPEPAPGGKVLDLMAALEKSVRAARQPRGEEVAEETETIAEPAQEAAEAEVGHLPRRTSARAATERTTKKQAPAAKRTAAKKTASAARKTASKPDRKTKKTASDTKAAPKKTPAKTPAKKAAARKRTA